MGLPEEIEMTVLNKIKSYCGHLKFKMSGRKFSKMCGKRPPPENALFCFDGRFDGFKFWSFEGRYSKKLESQCFNWLCCYGGRLLEMSARGGSTE